MTDRTRIRTDLALVAAVLATADQTSANAAARRHDVPPRTVGRWLTRRAEAGRPWPTADDIAAWRVEAAREEPRRARQRVQSDRYRKQVYLNRGPLQVDARGTVRRLQALAAIGWTSRDLAARLGVSAARVQHLQAHKYPTVFPSTLAAVDRVYRQLAMTVPEDPAVLGRGQVRVHARIRRIAARHGWAPPLAWDDIDTDPTPHLNRQGGRARGDVDPVVVDRILDGHHMPDATPTERRLALARWVARGRSEKSLCEAQGWKSGRYTSKPEEEAA